MFCTSSHSALYLGEVPENISKGFQLTEQSHVQGRNSYVQCSKGNNYQSRQTKVMVHVKFGKNIPDGMRVMEQTWMMKPWRTDRWTGSHVSLTLCCFVIYSMRQFVLSLALCYFVLVFFSPFSIAITSLGEERTNISAFRTFVWFALVWFCLFPLPPCVWDGLLLVIVALPGLFSYLFWMKWVLCDFLYSQLMVM